LAVENTADVVAEAGDVDAWGGHRNISFSSLHGSWTGRMMGWADTGGAGLFLVRLAGGYMSIKGAVFAVVALLAWFCAGPAVSARDVDSNPSSEEFTKWVSDFEKRAQANIDKDAALKKWAAKQPPLVLFSLRFSGPGG